MSVPKKKCRSNIILTGPMLVFIFIFSSNMFHVNTTMQTI